MATDMAEVSPQVYRKLVRDRIPEVIRGTGAHPVVRKLNPEEFLPAALQKVVEEAQELREAPSGERLEEIADLWEVLNALIEALDASWEEVFTLAATKRSERGGFTERLWLEAVLGHR